jgi:hypothetical protein
MPASETTGTLTVASANKTIQATGDITIPNASLPLATLS